MSRAYETGWTGTVTNAGGNNDLASLQAADDKPCYIDGFRIGQLSEVGDAAEEGLSITIYRFTATVTIGSGGSAVVPTAVDQADTAAGAKFRINDTVVATTSGSSLVLEEIAWNIRASPWETWKPESPVQIKQGEAWIMRLNTTVADDISFAMTLFFHE